MGKLPTQPLSAVPAGRRVRVVALASGRGLQSRLVSMGLTIGSELRILRGGAAGPTLVALGETRLAIGRGMAERIIVSARGELAGET